MSQFTHYWQPHLREFTAYSSARDEYQGRATAWLDANESPFASAYNRYPDPLQLKLRARIAGLRGAGSASLLLTHGSDEAIDLLLRATCTPGEDAILICPPTYGMYAVSASLQRARILEVPLSGDFQLRPAAILAAADQHRPKLIFLCSPNNPTGNLLREEQILEIYRHSKALLVIDEAYIDFAPEASWLSRLEQFPRLVILQTFSKAWALAGARVGMLWAHPEIIAFLQRMKLPYNIGTPAAQALCEQLESADSVRQQVAQLLSERQRLAAELQKLPAVLQVWPSDANFILIRVRAAVALYRRLLEQGLVTRLRHPGIAQSLRITVGLPQHNDALLKAIRHFS